MEPVEEVQIKTKNLNIGSLAMMLLEHGGFWEVSKPEKGIVPHLPQIGERVFVVGPSVEPTGPYSAEIVATDSGFLVKRYRGFPNGKPLNGFDPRNYV